MNSPFKEDREKCWSHRDNYWSCLDKNNEVAEKCLEMRKEFEKHCSKQWVMKYLNNICNFFMFNNCLHVNNKYFRCSILIGEENTSYSKPILITMIGLGRKKKNNSVTVSVEIIINMKY